MQRSFPVSNAGLAAASRFLSGSVAELGLSEAVAHRICVILDEVCANMLRHDETLDDSAHFGVQLDPAPGGVQMTVSDPGLPFNPLDFRHAAQPEIGGHGITLIKGLAQAVSYARTEDRNCLTVLVLDD